MGKGLTQMTRLLTPQRELARLQGTAGQVEASLAENRGKVAELEIELVRLTSKVREEAIAELRELEFREIEPREKRRSLKDQIARLDLRAPSSGIVYGSTVDTLRGVIRAAEPVMYVVPKGSPLVVKVKVETIHIDQVHLGQEAGLRFSAFGPAYDSRGRRPRHRARSSLRSMLLSSGILVPCVGGTPKRRIHRRPSAAADAVRAILVELRADKPADAAGSS